MTTIRVYEPALCCNTGVCGPTTDDALVAFTADLTYLKGQGVDIERHNLANDPAAFTVEPVLGFLRTAGSAGLPLTVVDGVTVRTGSYPTREELAGYAAAETPLGDSAPSAAAPAGARLLVGKPTTSAEPSACCGGSGCC